MKAPKTTGQLRDALANILAGAINGDISEREGRIALNAATRITESFQAETRMRAISLSAGNVPVPLGKQVIGEGEEE